MTGVQKFNGKSHSGPCFEDPDFVQATDVETEYERGYSHGIAAREALAKQVMEETMRIEVANQRLQKYLARFWFALFILAALDIIWLLR